MTHPRKTAPVPIAATATKASMEVRPQLERASAVSLHEQLLDRLRGQLRQHLQPGDQVPTEESLTREFAVSRSTVRKALDRLVTEGVLVRRQGKGTYLAHPIPSIVHSIDRLAPFVDTFKKQLGGDIRIETSAFAWSEDDAAGAALGWEGAVLSFAWRYLSAGVAHAITRTRLPAAIGRNLTYDDVARVPVYELLQKKLKITLAQSKSLVSCRPASAAEASALEISQSAYVLVLERITRSEGGDAVEATTHVLRPDVYQLSVELDDLRLKR